MPPHQFRRILLRQRRQGAQGRCPHVDIVVLHHALDCSGPADGDAGAGGGEGMKRARPDAGRLVMQQQRRDQVRAVESLQHVDRVENGLFLGIRQVFDQRLDRRRVVDVRPDPLGRDRPFADAGAKRLQVVAARDQRHRDPEPGHRDAGVAQAAPVEAEPPGFDQHQHQERRQRPGDSIHGHVDERLGAILQVRRQAAGTAARASSCRRYAAGSCRGRVRRRAPTARRS